MSFGNSYPVKSVVPGVVCAQGVWTGGGAAANMTKAAADWSKGIASVNYNAATGKYLVTFVDGGQQIVGCHCITTSTTGVISKKVEVLRATYSPSTKTVEIEIYTPATDLAATALVDLANTFKLILKFEFAQRSPDT